MILIKSALATSKVMQISPLRTCIPPARRVRLLDTPERLQVTHMPSIPQIRSIVAIDRFGTVTAAAEALGLSVSAVSNHLNGVERKLGVTLFSRKGGRFVSTKQGSTFLQLGRSTLALVDQMYGVGCVAAPGYKDTPRVPPAPQ